MYRSGFLCIEHNLVLHQGGGAIYSINLKWIQTHGDLLSNILLRVYHQPSKACFKQGETLKINSNTDRLKMNEKFEIWEASLVSGMNAFFYSFFELFRVQYNAILFI